MWNDNQAPFTNGIVNGCAWYIVDGGEQDWVYRHTGCNEITIETIG